jgi:hypothetical protein
MLLRMYISWMEHSDLDAAVYQEILRCSQAVTPCPLPKQSFGLCYIFTKEVDQ